MRALVTGGAGFIGSNLVDALLDRGDEVAVVDNLSTGKRENLSAALARGAGFDEADIRDAGRMRRLFAAARPDIVFHLAAQIDVRKSIEDPALDAGVNVVGTINVLEAARAAASSASSTPRPAARSTARPTSHADARERAAARPMGPPTGRASSAPRPTAAGTSASTACRR